MIEHFTFQDKVNYKFNSKEFLEIKGNYLWQDIIRLSISENISVARLIDRMFEELTKIDKDNLIKYIDNEVKKTIRGV